MASSQYDIIWQGLRHRNPLLFLSPAPLPTKPVLWGEEPQALKEMLCLFLARHLQNSPCGDELMRFARFNDKFNRYWIASAM